MLFLLFLVETTKMKETSQSTSATKNRRKKYIDAALFRVNPVVMTTIFLDYRETHITPRKVIQDNLILWIVRRGFWTPRSVDLGVWTQTVSGIPDSLSEIHGFWFHKQKFREFQNPDSLTWGDTLQYEFPLFWDMENTRKPLNC